MIKLKKELVQGLVNYLATRPYNEVAQVMPLLMEALQEEQSCQTTDNTAWSLGPVG